MNQITIIIFTSVFTKEDTNQIPTMDSKPYLDLPPIMVSCDGAAQLLSSGPDEIP